MLNAAAVDAPEPAPVWTCSLFSWARAQEWRRRSQGALLRNHQAVSTVSAPARSSWPGVRRSPQAWGRSHTGFTCISLKTDSVVAVGLCSEGTSVRLVLLLSHWVTCLFFVGWKESRCVPHVVLLRATRGPVTDAWPGLGHVAGSPWLGGVCVGPRQLSGGCYRTGGAGAHRPRQSWGSAGRRVWGQKELPGKEGSPEGCVSPGYPSPGFSKQSGGQRAMGRGGADWVRWAGWAGGRSAGEGGPPSVATTPLPSRPPELPHQQPCLEEQGCRPQDPV